MAKLPDGLVTREMGNEQSALLTAQQEPTWGEPDKSEEKKPRPSLQSAGGVQPQTIAQRAFI